MKPINLDALDTPRTVEKNGVPYHVRPITPRTASMIRAAADETEGEAKVVAFYNVIAALIPSMPRHEVEDLSTPQVLAILDLAGEQIHEVREAAGDVGDADPNAASPLAAGVSR